jgi:transposase-like protein
MMTEYLKGDGIPSYELAQKEAANGNIYCWLCASHHYRKAQKRSDGRKEFECLDCHAYFRYRMPTEIYDNIDGRKNKRKAQPDG